jgi:hypothetical protein
MAQIPSVTVYCKMWNGYTLQVDQKRVHLRGSAHYLQPNPNRKFKAVPEDQVIYGDTMTLVAEDFWLEWVRRMTHDGTEKFDPFEKGLIYAHKNKADGAAHARELENEKHGTEQIDPNVKLKDKKGRTVGGKLDDRETPDEE